MKEIPAVPLKKLLFPHVFQKVGWLLSIAGVVLIYLRFGIGIKPDILEINVFAIYSKYLDTKYFSSIQNNISEEIGGIVLLIGLFLYAFSCEKIEEDRYWIFRLKALLMAAYTGSAFVLLTLLFVFGLAFISIMTFYLILPLILYIVLFRYQMYKDRRNFRS